MVELLSFTSATYPEVTYNRVKVHVVLLDSNPWWNTARIFNMARQRVDERFLATFASKDMGWHLFDGHDEPVHVVSTVGALTIAARGASKANDMSYAWLRKKHGALTATPGVEPIPMPLTLLADGSLPPVPLYANDRFHWDVLNAEVRAARRASSTPYVPVGPSHKTALSLPEISTMPAEEAKAIFRAMGDELAKKISANSRAKLAQAASE